MQHCDPVPLFWLGYALLDEGADVLDAVGASARTNGHRARVEALGLASVERGAANRDELKYARDADAQCNTLVPLVMSSAFNLADRFRDRVGQGDRIATHLFLRNIHVLEESRQIYSPLIFVLHKILRRTSGTGCNIAIPCRCFG